MNQSLRVVFSAVWLPLLYWLLGVTVVTMAGYPGVVCLTPVAWLLALPVGLRVQQESLSGLGWLLAEGAAAGAVLGMGQGLLFAGAMAAAPWVDPSMISDPPDPWLAGLAGCILSMPVTAVLSALMAWIASRRAASNPS